MIVQKSSMKDKEISFNTTDHCEPDNRTGKGILQNIPYLTKPIRLNGHVIFIEKNQCEWHFGDLLNRRRFETISQEQKTQTWRKVTKIKLKINRLIGFRRSLGRRRNWWRRNIEQKSDGTPKRIKIVKIILRLEGIEEVSLRLLLFSDEMQMFIMKMSNEHIANKI